MSRLVSASSLDLMASISGVYPHCGRGRLRSAVLPGLGARLGERTLSVALTSAPALTAASNRDLSSLYLRTAVTNCVSDLCEQSLMFEESRQSGVSIGLPAASFGYSSNRLARVCGGI